MAAVLMYSTGVCPYCVRAEQLLRRKGIDNLEKVRVDLDPVQRDAMIERAGGLRTVPQIFINGAHIGGCDELYALEHAGKLDSLLAASE